MRILHVIHSLDPRSGGPSHAIRQIVREQVRCGHEVSLLATTVQSAEPWEATDVFVARMMGDPAFRGAEVNLGWAFGRRRPWSRYAYSPPCAGWLRRRLADPHRHPAIVHVHGVFSHVTTVAAAYARRYGIPYIMRPAGSFDARCLTLGRRRWKAVFSHLFVRNDLLSAARVHTTSEYEADDLRRWLPTAAIQVVPHGVDVPMVDRQAAAARLRERYPLLARRRIVLFMSRLVAKKRPELVAEAVAHVRRECPDLALLFAGNDAGHRVAVEETIRRHAMEDCAVIAGFLEGEAKQEALAASDVFVLPSVDENFGIAVVEAMAHALPVVVAPGVAAHRYVDQSGCGLTVEGTVESLAEGIKRILNGDGAAMGRRGREFVRQHLSWPAVMRQYDSMYLDALGKETNEASSPRPLRESTTG